MNRILSNALLATVSAFSAGTTVAADVTTWVPPYQLAQSRQSLQHRTGDIDAGQWITRLGLQFWIPSEDGTLQFARRGEPLGADDVRWFVDWGRQHGVKVLLTVYNFRNDHWDWALARSAFRDHQQALVTNLVAEVERHGLDGVDLDLEGNGALDADRADFARFVGLLSATLKSRGKQLTIDSFHSPCFNAPNMAWWEDWKDQVDAIHSMGYGDLYEGSTETFTPEGGGLCVDGAALFRYSWQADWGVQHGVPAAKVLMGIPGGDYAWGKGAARKILPEQLRSVAAVGAGIAIWDVNGIVGTRKDARWGSKEAWQALVAFRTGVASPLQE